MLFQVIRRPIAAGLIPVLALNGCYAYLPASNPSPREGAEVRAELAGPESFAIGEQSFFNIGTVEGEITRSDDDSLVAISVTWLRSWRGSEKYWGQGALLFIPHDRIDLLEERRFSAGRTAVAAGLGGLALAAVIGIAAALKTGSGNPPGGSGGGTEF